MTPFREPIGKVQMTLRERKWRVLSGTSRVLQKQHGYERNEVVGVLSCWARLPKLLSHAIRRGITKWSRSSRQMICLAGDILTMLEVGIALALILLAGVLWLRPWYDDHYHPYD